MRGAKPLFVAPVKRGFAPLNNNRKKIRLSDFNHRQRLCEGGVQCLFFGELGVEFGAELCEAFGEVEVVVLVGQAHVAAGGENVVEFRHTGHGHGGAEALDVFVRAVGVAPVVIGGADGCYIVRRENAGTAVDEFAHIAGVDKEDFVAAVAEVVVAPVAGKEPETGGNLRIR